MREASKLRKILTQNELSILNGDGIDIGCGDDPISSNVAKFDLAQGNAQHITKYVKRCYDFVFSSHCLEHMEDPWAAIKEWWGLVKPGGHMIIIVPDEDLYEQGNFPSLFNADHKWTFTISKNKSWSPKSVNLLDLVQSLSCSQLIKLELQDNNYDRTLLGKKRHNAFCASLKLVNILRIFRIPFGSFNNILSKSSVIDQTLFPDTLAQIMAIVRKDSQYDQPPRNNNAESDK